MSTSLLSNECHEAATRNSFAEENDISKNFHYDLVAEVPIS